MEMINMNNKVNEGWEEGLRKWENEFHILEIHPEDLEDMYKEHLKGEGDD